MVIRFAVSLLLLFPVLAQAARIRILVAESSHLALHADEVLIASGGKYRLESTKINLRVCGRQVCFGKYSSPVVEIRSDAPWIYLGKRQLPTELRVAVAGKRLQLIALLDVESYLQGVLGSEMSPGWPLAALQAQAVVSRTYAWYRKHHNRNKSWDLRTTTRDQVYRFGRPPGPVIRRAVRSTAGWIMTLDGDPIEAFFHADCGGHTADAQEVWGKAVPGIVGVKDRWCVKVTHPWTYTLKSSDGRELGVGRLKKIRILERTTSGRVRHLLLEGSRRTRRITGEELRKLVGYTTIKSTRFDVKNLSGKIQIVGSGYGHGLGLCQIGAREQALEGRSWQDILDLYFPTTMLIPAE